MKRLYFIFLAVPLFAITYLHVGGSPSGEFEVPASINLTSDVSEPGNVVMFHVYSDQDGDEERSEGDMLVHVFGMIDGVPTIGDPTEDEYIAGDDDSLVNGLMSHTAFFGDEDFMFAPGFDENMRMFIEATDMDGSSASCEMILIPGEIGEASLPYISGYITDEVSGSGIEDIYILVEDPISEMEYMGKTDSDGYYRADLPDGGRYILSGVLDLSGNYSSLADVGDTVFVEEGDSSVYDAVLHPFDASITGRVTSEGEGIPGLIVYSTPMTYLTFAVGMTDEDGYYTLGADIGGGPYIMGVSFDSDKYTCSPEYAMVDVDAEEVGPYDFELTLLPNYVEGFLYRADGETPIPGARISALGDEGVYSATTKENGHYRIFVVPGTYIIRPDFALTVLPENYRVTAGDSAITGLDFAVEAGLDLPDLSGNVSTDGGEPIENAYVILQPQDDFNIIEWRYTMTDASGDYTFADLLPGYVNVGTYKETFGTAPELAALDIVFGSDYTANFTAMLDGIMEKVARSFEILGVYPNPFNPTTSIELSLETPTEIELTIFDIKGKIVLQETRLVSNNVKIEAANLPSGTYMYNINTKDGVRKSGTMTLIK